MIAAAARGAQKSLESLLARRRKAFLEDRQFRADEDERLRVNEERQQRVISAQSTAAHAALQNLPPGADVPLSIVEALQAEGHADAYVQRNEARQIGEATTAVLGGMPLSSMTLDRPVSAEEALGEAFYNEETNELELMPAGITQDEYREYVEAVKATSRENAEAPETLVSVNPKSQVPHIVQQDTHPLMQSEVFYSRRLSPAERAEQAQVEKKEIQNRSLGIFLDPTATPEQKTQALQGLFVADADPKVISDMLDLHERFNPRRPGQSRTLREAFGSFVPVLKLPGVGDELVPVDEHGNEDVPAGIKLAMEIGKYHRDGRPKASEPLNPYQQFTMTRTLQQDFENDKGIANFVELERQYDIMAVAAGSIEATFSAALQSGNYGKYNQAAQAILVTFQKMLDPTSVVRESEYARSANGLAFLSRMYGMVQGLILGGADVPVGELKNFVSLAKSIRDSAKRGVAQRVKNTKNRAERAGLGDAWADIVGVQFSGYLDDPTLNITEDTTQTVKGQIGTLFDEDTGQYRGDDALAQYSQTWSKSAPSRQETAKLPIPTDGYYRTATGYEQGKTVERGLIIR